MLKTNTIKKNTCRTALAFLLGTLYYPASAITQDTFDIRIQGKTVAESLAVETEPPLPKDPSHSESYDPTVIGVLFLEEDYLDDLEEPRKGYFVDYKGKYSSYGSLPAEIGILEYINPEELVDKILEINRKYGNTHLKNGTPLEAIKSALAYRGVANQTAALVRSITGDQMFLTGNVRTAMDLVIYLEKVYQVPLKDGEEELMDLLKRIEAGEFDSINEIANGLKA